MFLMLRSSYAASPSLRSIKESKSMAEIKMNNEEGDHQILEKKEGFGEDNVYVINSNNNISLHTSTPSISTSSSLPELNLLMVLSSLSLPPGEALDYEVTDKKIKAALKDSRANHRPVSRISHVKQREMNELRASAPQSTRFQTKIRDCRHCRRM